MWVLCEFFHLPSPCKSTIEARVFAKDTAEPMRSECPEINPATPASVERRLIICSADDGDFVVLPRFTLLLRQFLVRTPQRWVCQLQ